MRFNKPNKTLPTKNNNPPLTLHFARIVNPHVLWTNNGRHIYRQIKCIRGTHICIPPSASAVRAVWSDIYYWPTTPIRTQFMASLIRRKRTQRRKRLSHFVEWSMIGLCQDDGQTTTSNLRVCDEGKRNWWLEERLVWTS